MIDDTFDYKIYRVQVLCLCKKFGSLGMVMKRLPFSTSKQRITIYYVMSTSTIPISTTTIAAALAIQ